MFIGRLVLFFLINSFKSMAFVNGDEFGTAGINNLNMETSLELMSSQV